MSDTPITDGAVRSVLESDDSAIVREDMAIVCRSLERDRAELLGAMREIETICMERVTACGTRMGTRPGNCIATVRAAIAKATGDDK
ncbi:MAG: hypothetical protein ACYDBH_00605 [Acidobacteriaceae bacterium]